MSGGGQHRNALPAGYRLEHYRLESVLGHGGFGITYRALDEDLQQAVAIKEYLPREVAARDRDATVVPLSEADTETFTWGLERFLDEARTLARFRHPNIVGVRRFLRANGTAYLVMDYCEGESLEGVLAREGTLSAARVGGLLVPLLNALEALHAAGVTHRDVKPGNIFLRADGSPVLLDFGAARQALAQHSRSVTALATPGYAAFEQYSTKGRQGPWTDIYGLGATLYRCVSGQRPPDAGDRMFGEELVPAVEAGSGRYPRPLLEQIDAALQLRPEDRPQSIDEWRRFGHGSVAVQPRSGVPVASPVVVGTVHRDRLQDGTLGPEIVFIRGGTFTMGSPASEAGRFDNARQHGVSVGDVWIGKYAVTFYEYDQFARATGRALPGDAGWGRGRRPVINVSWYDATAYAEWLSGETGQRYRLPTEAEWEYACRGGEQQRYCGSDNVDAVAWYSGNSGSRTQPVGGKQANRFGLYDMSGNVCEWTCSVYDAGYGGAEQRCDASGELRVLRGGSWFYLPVGVRSASRGGGTPGARNPDQGFRLARSP